MEKSSVDTQGRSYKMEMETRCIFHERRAALMLTAFPWEKSKGVTNTYNNSKSLLAQQDAGLADHLEYWMILMSNPDSGEYICPVYPASKFCIWAHIIQDHKLIYAIGNWMMPYWNILYLLYLERSFCILWYSTTNQINHLMQDEWEKRSSID